MKLRQQNFLCDLAVQKLRLCEHSTSNPQIKKIHEPEKIKHILIGSHKSVTTTMHILQQLEYADMKDWSPLLPTHNPGEFISVLIKAVAVQ